VDEEHLRSVLDTEERDGRFADAKLKNAQHEGRSYFVNLHRERSDAQQWMEKQVYLALGALLVGAAALGIDSCPMEGFDQAALDEALGLKAKGLTSCVIVPLGYRAAGDFNAALPKSRLPLGKVITRL
jgi:nitroreductase/dihydropteridine reductase